jgi:hypothetical protein
MRRAPPDRADTDPDEHAAAAPSLALRDDGQTQYRNRDETRRHDLLLHRPSRVFDAALLPRIQSYALQTSR